MCLCHSRFGGAVETTSGAAMNRPGLVRAASLQHFSGPSHLKGIHVPYSHLLFHTEPFSSQLGLFQTDHWRLPSLQLWDEQRITSPCWPPCSSVLGELLRSCVLSSLWKTGADAFLGDTCPGRSVGLRLSFRGIAALRYLGSCTCFSFLPGRGAAWGPLL